MSDRVPNAAVLSSATRSGRSESWHRGALVVLQEKEGAEKVLFSAGDPEQAVICRSAIKPMQALPLLERGVAERLRLNDRELAVITASHNGTDEHLQVVEGLLQKGGLSPQDLGCGPHEPFDQEASLGLARARQKPQRIHNNCSGKHAGFLLLAKDMGVPLADYLDPECAAQKLVRRTVGEMAGVDGEGLPVGVDGCSAPTLSLPLRALARAFCRLTNPERLPPVRQGACNTLLRALRAEPVCVAGHGRLETALLHSAPGRIVPKNGAEGVYAMGLPGRGIGIAMKVHDGANRGYYPVVVDLLLALGLWPELPRELRQFHRVPIRNALQEVVGEVSCSVSWPFAAASS